MRSVQDDESMTPILIAMLTSNLEVSRSAYHRALDYQSEHISWNSAIEVTVERLNFLVGTAHRTSDKKAPFDLEMLTTVTSTLVGIGHLVVSLKPVDLDSRQPELSSFQ